MVVGLFPYRCLFNVALHVGLSLLAHEFNMKVHGLEYIEGHLYWPLREQNVISKWTNYVVTVCGNGQGVF